MEPETILIPVDRLKIITKIKLDPDFYANNFAGAKDFIQARNIEARASKPYRENYRGLPRWCLHLAVLNYKGINVILKLIGGAYAVAAIDFNPGVCLYGHNGRVLDVYEFQDALNLLVHHLQPLLHDPADWTSLVPGTRPGGPAYWIYIELFLQCRDPHKQVSPGSRNLRHPRIRKETRHWATSIEAGGKKSNLRLSIYRKAVEMHAKDILSDGELAEYEDVLRMEARLKDVNLLRYLGNERNTEEIDGKKRLVRFLPEDLVRAHRSIFGELSGVYSSGEVIQVAGPRQQSLPMGQFAASIAMDERVAKSYPGLIKQLGIYTRSSISPDIKKAGEAYIESLSTLIFEEIFSDESYARQADVIAGETEKKVKHGSHTIFQRSEIKQAYFPRILISYFEPDRPSYMAGKF